MTDVPNFSDPAKRNESRRRNYEQTRANAKNGKTPWGREEVKAIHSRTWWGRTNLTDRELSEELGRSVQAIQIHRSRTTA